VHDHGAYVELYAADGVRFAVNGLLWGAKEAGLVKDARIRVRARPKPGKKVDLILVS
jgi:hypothetical protein